MKKLFIVGVLSIFSTLSFASELNFELTCEVLSGDFRAFPPTIHFSQNDEGVLINSERSDSKIAPYLHPTEEGLHSIGIFGEYSGFVYQQRANEPFYEGSISNSKGGGYEKVRIGCRLAVDEKEFQDEALKNTIHSNDLYHREFN